MSTEYELGIRINGILNDMQIERLNIICRAYHVNTFDKIEFNQCYKDAMIYFRKHRWGWNPIECNHLPYVKLEEIYSLKNDWDIIVKKPIIASQVMFKMKNIPEIKEIKPALDISKLHPQNIAIDIGENNKILSRAIQSLFFDKGYRWTNTGEFYDTPMRYLLLDSINNKYICHSNHPPDLTIIDPTKIPLGDLITIFNNPVPPPELKIHGHKAEKYVKSLSGSGSVSFGCAKISIGLLRDVYKWMKNRGAACNRTISSITLGDSGKVLTKEQVKQILDWFDKQPENS